MHFHRGKLQIAYNYSLETVYTYLLIIIMYIKAGVIMKIKIALTSGTLVSYGVFIKAGALSLISDTRTIIGMLRLRRVERIVHEI